MTDIDVNTCGCCREIWNRNNMKSIKLGENTLYLCPDCYREYLKSVSLNALKDMTHESLFKSLFPSIEVDTSIFGSLDISYHDSLGGFRMECEKAWWNTKRTDVKLQERPEEDTMGDDMFLQDFLRYTGGN